MFWVLGSAVVLDLGIFHRFSCGVLVIVLDFGRYKNKPTFKLGLKTGLYQWYTLRGSNPGHPD